jgi:small ligand-binding sensory domain FIST
VPGRHGPKVAGGRRAASTWAAFPPIVAFVPFASAMSEHPVTAHAVGEVTGQVLERLGERPDLVLVFVTPPHAGALEDVVGAVDAVLHPLVLIGGAAESVAGPHREVEQSAAVTLLAARTGPLVPLALDAVVDPVDDTVALGGWPAEVAFEPQAALLVADPYSFPVEESLAWIDRRYRGLPVVGGLASAGRGPGGNRLALGTTVRTAGAVGALLGPGIAVETVVSQGCRPFGHPLVVTKAEGNVIFELAGRPALERLVGQAHDTLDEEEVRLLETGGLHLGRVIDEHRDNFGRGDFLVRNVVGADRRSGAIAVGDVVPVGTTVQFHLRDADSADVDLHEMLRGRRADAALLFTCNGRGTRLFEAPDHDVGVLTDELGPIAVTGFFAAGELGPVAGQNFLHGFTASVALLRDLRPTS